MSVNGDLPMRQRPWLRVGMSLVLAASLAACGFHLRGRGSAELPPHLSSLRVTMSGPAYASLLVEMRNALTRQAGVHLTEDPQAGVPILTLSDEYVENQVVAIDASGTVSDFLLNYRVKFTLTAADGRTLLPLQSVKLQREYTFDKLNVLAKEKEDEFLRREMQRDAVQQIIRRLAAAPAQP